MCQSKNNLARTINENKTTNPYDLADLLDIMIVPVPLSKKIKGFHQYSPVVKFLHINENLNNIDKFTVLCQGIETICNYPKHNIIFFQDSFTLTNKDYYKNLNTPLQDCSTINKRTTLNYLPLEELKKKYNYDCILD